MRCTLATLALAAVAVANPVPQGVTSAIAPSGSAPEGCSPDFSGSFQIQVVKASAKRDLAARQAGALIITLSGGVLMDNDGRTGYIAANHQFQFDDPPQTGAIYTAGWSVCSNGSLAIGPNAVFYQCLSGTFYNLYDESTGAQCSPVYIDAIGSGGSAPAPVPSGGASVMSDGQPTAGPAVTQISDGQIQAPVCTEIVDGQPQCPTAPACTEIVDGQPQCPSGAPVTQISDGQIQAPTATPAAPVTQISDGQIQAPTSVPCTEIVDGQPQCPTAAPPAAPVTQISDGQIQAPTATPAAPVTQISDGQIQAPSGVVTQISDGQIQAPSATPCTQIVDGQPQCPSGAANYSSPATPAPSVVPATGAASTFTIGNSVFGLVAVVFAVMLL